MLTCLRHSTLESPLPKFLAKILAFLLNTLYVFANIISLSLHFILFGKFCCVFKTPCIERFLSFINFVNINGSKPRTGERDKNGNIVSIIT